MGRGVGGDPPGFSSGTGVGGESESVGNPAPVKEPGPGCGIFDQGPVNKFQSRFDRSGSQFKSRL